MRIGPLPKLLIFSVIFIVGGIISLITSPIIFKNLLVIQPDSKIFTIWQKFPAKIPLNFYFFNWTNPQDIYNRSVRPTFKELGPFSYWQTEDKQNITFNDNGTVTYRQVKHFYHNAKNSKDIKINVTTLDTIGASVAYFTRHFSPVLRQMTYYSIVSLGHDIYYTHSVEKLLFTGFEDIFVILTSISPFFSNFWYKNWDRAGWIFGRNGSYEYEGILNIGTGKDSELGTMYSWNYANRTSYYEGHCAQVKGSAGQLYNSLNKDKLTVFSVDLGRYVTLKYVGEEYVSNILGYKYILADDTLDNGTMFPENKCFCDGECLPFGMFNISSTKLGLPVFISLPHFYRADPYYINSIEGMKPDKEKHEASIVIEPRTGIPLRVDIAVQVNFMLDSNPDLPLYRDIPRTIFPVMWIQENIKIPDELFDILKLFFLISTVCKCTAILAISIGFFQIVFIIYKRYKLLNLDRKKCLYTRQNTNCRETNHTEKVEDKQKYRKLQACFSIN